VRSLLTVGYNAGSNAAVWKLKQALPRVPTAVGLHPWYAREEVGPVLSLIDQIRPTAVGEVGLDGWPDPELPKLGRQIEVLEAQLDLSERLHLPVTLHSRGAVNELSGVLKRFPRVRGVLHAFGGSLEQARGFLEQGLYFGIGGAVTRGRAKRVRRLAQSLPLDRLVVETDAPAMGMEGVEPPHVRPAHLGFREVELSTDDSALRVFGRDVAWDPTESEPVELEGWHGPRSFVEQHGHPRR
ncbi:TatD family hydrolase, partial [Myxococcota bacterium]